MGLRLEPRRGQLRQQLRPADDEEAIGCHNVLEGIMTVMSSIALCAVSALFFDATAEASEAAAHSCWLTGCGA
jgi:hypothetical protein